jgi:hypothetical protein
MAKLHPKSLDWPQNPGETFDAYYDRKDRLLAELAKTHKLVHFPWADGSAVYLVTREKPLELQHVAVGDAWQVPYAYIRGTTLEDVNREAAASKAMAEYVLTRKVKKS